VQCEVFGCKENDVTGDWRQLLGSFGFRAKQVLLGCQNKGGQGTCHISGSW
jgi:hypothetical protein